MNNRRGCLIFLLGGGVILSLLAWYLGLIPGASDDPRSRIQHALNLPDLPASTVINTSGIESWTDYILEADITIDPADFDHFLSGRNFSKTGVNPYQPETSAYYISDYQGFLIAEEWTWAADSERALPEGKIGAHCTLYVNAERDRLFIRYVAD